ncbi:hypothetical protein HY213_02355 [Candidatus Peregrinibacteria bacterium]|nr:hypothetical protein [Candidatus Peregrinibacteria bacterium]
MFIDATDLVKDGPYEGLPKRIASIADVAMRFLEQNFEREMVDSGAFISFVSGLFRQCVIEAIERGDLVTKSQIEKINVIAPERLVICRTLNPDFIYDDVKSRLDHIIPKLASFSLKIEKIKGIPTKIDLIAGGRMRPRHIAQDEKGEWEQRDFNWRLK